MRNEKLTGAIRYRADTRLFGPLVLVLQVRVRFGNGPPDSNGMPSYLSGETWRDARVEDLLEITQKETPDLADRG